MGWWRTAPERRPEVRSATGAGLRSSPKYKPGVSDLASLVRVLHLPAPCLSIACVRYSAGVRARRLLPAGWTPYRRGCCRQPRAHAPVVAQLDRAAGDWNRGDLDAFVSDYAPESTTTFVDGRRARRGFDFIRKNATPDCARRRRRQPPLGEVEVRRLVKSLALVTARCILQRGGSTSASGPFLVMGGAEGWKILHDHSSSDPR